MGVIYWDCDNVRLWLLRRGYLDSWEIVREFVFGDFRFSDMFDFWIGGFLCADRVMLCDVDKGRCWDGEIFIFCDWGIVRWGYWYLEIGMLWEFEILDCDVGIVWYVLYVIFGDGDVLRLLDCKMGRCG